MRERHQLFFGLRLAGKKFHHSAFQTKIEENFGGFLHQMKVRQPIGRQDSMQSVNQTSRRLDSFLHEAAQNFELLSNIQELKFSYVALIDILTFSLDRRGNLNYTVKKGERFSRPKPGCHLRNSPWPGII
jgi:hypothetical protein